MKELRNQRKVADNEQTQFKNLFWATVRLQFPELLGKVSVTLTEAFEVAYDEEAQKSSASMEEAGGELRQLFELLELSEVTGAGSIFKFRR